MTGKSHTDPAAKPFALEVMQHMNDACAKWKADAQHRLQPLRHPAGVHHLQVCQVPAEALRHHRPASPTSNYITNSYHVHVTEEIDAFNKLKFEAEFQTLSPGRRHQLRGGAQHAEQPGGRAPGHEASSMTTSCTPSSTPRATTARCCGYDGEIEIVEDDGKLVWELPQVRQPRPEQDERRPPHLRLHRHPVLEPGPHRRRSRTACCICDLKMHPVGPD